MTASVANPLRALLLVLAILPTIGCLMAEQVGELPKDDISFHCRTGFNKSVVGLRSLALGGIAAWLTTTTRRKGLAAMLALPFCGVAGWLLLAGFGRISTFAIAVTPDALSASISGEAREIPWGNIEELRVRSQSDIDTVRVRSHGVTVDVPMGAPLGQPAAGFERMEEIHALRILTADGEHIEIDLGPLSREQRHSLFKAIVSRAALRPVA